MSMMIKRHCRVRISPSILILSLLLLHPSCKAQDENSGLNSNIFTKPEFTPTFSPNGNGTLIPPSTLLPTKSPSEYNDESIFYGLIGHERCEIHRDIYCNMTGDGVDLNIFHRVEILNTTQITRIEEEICRTVCPWMVGELGVSYRPLVRAQINYLARTGTKPRGFSVSKYADVEVRALAMGVVISGISTVDPVHGTFDATLKLYFFDITNEPFSTIHEAVDTIYKKSSRTTAATNTNSTSADDSIFFRLHEEDKADAWKFPETEDGERVHPDGICTASVVSTMKPIPFNTFKFDEVLRLPRSKATIHPRADASGHLSHVDVSASFTTRSLNREFYPFQIDLLDMLFEMGSSNLITEDQRIVKNLLCLHPSYTGFGNYVYGSDAKAGMETSDALTMVPYIYYDFVEPWITADNDHFHYNETRQTSEFGRGFNLRRMIGLRIIVEHPPGKGLFEVLPILFVSLTSIANFVSSDAATVGASSMVQALLGVNSLVTQNVQFIGQSTVMAQSLVLAYCITGIWIFAVVLMMVISKAKKHGNGNKWYVVYQQQIFNYLRMIAESLLLVYVPYLSAYSADKGNGRQKRVTWAWALCISVIVFMFIVRAVIDYHLIRKRKRDKEVDSIKAQVFSSKPLNQWSQDEVLNWIRNGPMNRESYFAEAKRLSVAEKLENAFVDGELLSEYGADVDKLVQLIGLPLGDAAKLSQELALLNNKTDINVTEVPTALSLYRGAFPD